MMVYPVRRAPFTLACAFPQYPAVSGRSWQGARKDAEGEYAAENLQINLIFYGRCVKKQRLYGVLLNYRGELLNG
jgi:hypothetical protein